MWVVVVSFCPSYLSNPACWKINNSQYICTKVLLLLLQLLLLLTSVKPNILLWKRALNTCTTWPYLFFFTLSLKLMNKSRHVGFILQPSHEENRVWEEGRGAQTHSHVKPQSGKISWLKTIFRKSNKMRGGGGLLTCVDWGALAVVTGASLRWDLRQHWAIYIERSDMPLVCHCGGVTIHLLNAPDTPGWAQWPGTLSVGQYMYSD